MVSQGINPVIAKRIAYSFALAVLAPIAFAVPAPWGPLCIVLQGLHVWVWLWPEIKSLQGELRHG